LAWPCCWLQQSLSFCSSFCFVPTKSVEQSFSSQTILSQNYICSLDFRSQIYIL
jgi:hypothetical protein